MDNYQDTKCLALEKALDDESGDPIVLSFSFLNVITKQFSDNQLIGSGGFGSVYKGELRNGMVAVKKLHDKIEVLEKNFQNEVDCLIKVKHKNIVRFLGYCSETQHLLTPYGENYVWADVRQRLFCFEYLSKGSLAEYLTKASSGLPWRVRYQIIKGICEGVDYLHQHNIIHMDLKPQNILMDGSMVPKIADFGLSRRLSEEQSGTITENIVGTLGYLAPEFLSSKTITFKTDIYSLGVIIMEILMGCKERLNVDKVLESWTDILWTSERQPLLEQVKVCAEIGINCMGENPRKRPAIHDIICMLHETDISNSSLRSVLVDSSAPYQQEQSALGRFYQHYRLAKKACKPMRISAFKGPGKTGTELQPRCLSESALLDVHPLELCFPFEAKKVAQCSLSLINRTDLYLAYFIRPQFQDMYTIDLPISSYLDPMSTLVLNVKMVEQELPPLDTGMFEILMISMKSKEDLNLESSIGKDPQEIDDLLKQAEELGDEVHVAMLTAAVCPPRDAAPKTQVISRVCFQDIGAIDVHSTQPWILVGYGNRLSIWSYEIKAKALITLYINDKAQESYGIMRGHARVTSVRFIPREEWCVAGDDTGHIHVYAFLTMEEIKSFKAAGCGSVQSLAIHPTYSYLLSACEDDGMIEIWDWGKGWTCSAKVQTGHSVTRATFNPMDANTFVISRYRVGAIEVWSINPSAHQPITIIGCHGSLSHADHIFNEAAGRNHVIVVSYFDTNPHIWDLQTGTRVHTFSHDPGLFMCTAAACHPTLPLIAASGVVDLFSDDAHPAICFWNSTNHRLEKTVRCTSIGEIKYLGFVGARSLVIGSESEIQVLEIDLESLACQQ